jgi:acyl carrier protein
MQAAITPPRTRLPAAERAGRPRADNTVGPNAMTSTSSDLQPQRPDLIAVMVDYILSQHPSKYTAETLPHDQSLLELGILDSAGVIEFIVFVESTWGIEISDEDITKERMGSLIKMAVLVDEYLARKQ